MRKNMKAVALATGVVVLGGGGIATAETLITGSNVKNSSLTGADVKNNGLTGKDIKDVRSGDIRDGSIQAKDLSPALRQALASAGTAGASGAPGTNGTNGATGAQGPQGAAGTNGTNGANGAPGKDGIDAAKPKRITATNADTEGFGQVRDPFDPTKRNPPQALTSTFTWQNDALRFDLPNGQLLGRSVPIPVGTKLSDLSSLSYVARSNKADVAMPFKIEIDFNGPTVTGGFSTLVFEPENEAGRVPGGQPALANTWQLWHPLDSVWRSTRDINDQKAVDSNNAFVYRNWDAIVASNPNATVGPFGAGGSKFEPGTTSGATGWNGYSGEVDRATVGVGSSVAKYDLGGK